MKQNMKCLGFFAFILAGMFAENGRLQAAEPTGEIQVLFIGNSFTVVHHLPRMLAACAKAGGQGAVLHEAETPGGCTLEKHWKDGNALVKIKSRKWDFVVLQEQSETPLLNRASMFEYGRKFDTEIRKQGAKTILYMTWAKQNEPENQAAISKAYQDLAKDLKVQLAPVGNAWKRALGANKELVLHNKDRRHPNATGTYLAACVFYATIFGKSPEGLPGSIGKLTDEEARPLQVIAWKTVHGIGK